MTIENSALRIEPDVERFASVLLVGSGAVMSNRDPQDDSSWVVVRRGLNRCYGPQHPITSNNESLALANLVFKRRWAYMNSTDGKSGPVVKQVKDSVDSEYEGVIENLVASLKEAEERQELVLRKEFSKIESHFCMEPTSIITTNWDTLLDKHFAKRFPVHHLHGSVLDPSIMLLPSEMTQEPYRTRDSLTMLMARHSLVIKTVERAEHIIIYGLSLSPLDAELSICIGDGLRSSGKARVTVIDKNPEVVVERLRSFDGSLRVEVAPLERFQG